MQTTAVRTSRKQGHSQTFQGPRTKRPDRRRRRTMGSPSRTSIKTKPRTRPLEPVHIQALRVIPPTERNHPPFHILHPQMRRRSRYRRRSQVLHHYGFRRRLLASGYGGELTRTNSILRTRRKETL